MFKKNISFICNICAHTYIKWQGCCYNCNSYNSIIENEIKEVIKKSKKIANFQSIENINISQHSIRITTGILEFDRVLGGGILENSVIFLSGHPGIGKSTFLLQLVCALSDKKKIIYISTEESEEQIKLRLLRIENKKTNWDIVQETHFEIIINTIEIHKPELVIIDSLQNMVVEDADGFSGHIQKLKEMMQILVDHAKKNRYIIIITGHVTKDGSIAGPKLLEHLVDTVLYFQAEEDSPLRILRSTKNRFGSIDEVGFFTMTKTGMQECQNPQEFFIENNKPAIGSALTWIEEGSRPFLIEIQTLLNKTRNNTPQRIIHGLDNKQFLLLCAVLEKYLKIPLYEYDIFSKVAGNYKIKSPHADLAIIMSILSSYANHHYIKKIVYHGEISLSGRITTKYSISDKLPLEKYGIEELITAKGYPKECIISKLELDTIFQIPALF
jgi:DNA repair protein RadA/Sms